MSPRINARVVSPPQPVGGLAGLGLPGAHIILTPSGLLLESLEVDPRPDFCLASSHANGADGVYLRQQGALS